jgi:hypothetical protein
VFTLLNGACFDFVAILPQDRLMQFETSLLNYLRSNKFTDDQELSILCIGILTALSSARKRGLLRIPAEYNSSDFLAGPGAAKAVDLLALHVVDAYNSRTLTDDKSIERIQTARSVVQFIEPEWREKWAQKKPVSLTKLVEKLQSHSRSTEVKGEVSIIYIPSMK